MKQTLTTEEVLRQRVQGAIREEIRLRIVWENAVERAKTGAPGARHAEEDAAYALGLARKQVNEQMRQLMEHCRRRYGYG